MGILAICTYAGVSFRCLRELALMDIILVRILFVILLASVCYFLRPFGLSGWEDAITGGGSRRRGYCD